MESRAEQMPNQDQFAEERTLSDVISDIGWLVSSDPDSGDIYARITGLVGELIEFDRFSISLVDPETGSLEDIHVIDGDSPERGIGFGHRISGTRIGSAVEGGRAVGIDGNTLDANWPGAEELVADGLQSILTAPVIIDGALAGVMMMAKKDPGGFVARDIAVVGGIALLISDLVDTECRNREAARELAEKKAVADLTRDVEHFLQASDSRIR
jgi:GAF domain-containing protein